MLDPAIDSLPAAGTSGTSVDDFMSMHTNFGSLTSLVRSVEGGPMSRLIQDQVNLTGYPHMLVLLNNYLEISLSKLVYNAYLNLQWVYILSTHIMQ